MIEQVAPPALAAWFAQDEQAAPVLLDVREPWELAVASVRPAGFRLCAIPLGQLAARLAELAPQARVACLCHHGARSQAAAGLLANCGYTVCNVSGGIDAWSRQHDAAVPRY